MANCFVEMCVYKYCYTYGYYAQTTDVGLSIQLQEDYRLRQWAIHSLLLDVCTLAYIIAQDCVIVST